MGVGGCAQSTQTGKKILTLFRELNVMYFFRMPTQITLHLYLKDRIQYILEKAEFARVNSKLFGVNRSHFGILGQFPQNNSSVA